MRPDVILAGLLPAPAGAGCASADDRAGSASDAAVRMLRAVRDRVGATACALLAPDIAAAVHAGP